jgi:hypothetical protein
MEAMSGTRRTPIGRTPGPRITPESVALFERGMRLRAQQDWSREIADNAVALTIALGMKPWQWDVFDCPNDAPPPWMTDQDKIDDYLNSRAIRLELERALRAKRRAQRKAPASAPSEPSPAA